MPVVTDFTSNLINKQQEKSFFDSDINKEAEKDFCYLVTRSAMSYTKALSHIVVSSSKKSNILAALVVGQYQNKGSVAIPAKYFDFNEIEQVAVVLYDSEDEVSGVYLHHSKNFKEKQGLFSSYKYNKKTDEYVLKINTSKWDEFKFGVVLGDHINM